MKRNPAAASLADCLEGCTVKAERERCQQLPKPCCHIVWPLDSPQIKV